MKHSKKDMIQKASLTGFKHGVSTAVTVMRHKARQSGLSPNDLTLVLSWLDELETSAIKAQTDKGAS